MAELINNGFQEFTPEMLKTQEGVNILNNIIKQLVDNVPSDLENVRIFKGYGTPEASVTAGIGSLYMRIDGAAGTSTYQKQSGTGNTGWVAVPGGSGSYSLTVEEQDGAPSVADVVKIKFPNGKVTDDGSGVVSVTVGTGDVVGPSSATDNALVRFDGTTGKLVQNSNITVDDTGKVVNSITESVGGSSMTADNLVINRTAAGSADTVTARYSEAQFTSVSGTQGIVLGGLSKTTVGAGSTVTAAIGHYFQDSPTGTKTHNFAAAFGGRVCFDSSAAVPGNPTSDNVVLLPASHVLKLLNGTLQIGGTAGGGQLILGDGTSTNSNTIFINTSAGSFTPITFTLTGGGDGIIRFEGADRVTSNKFAVANSTLGASVTIPTNGLFVEGHSIEEAGSRILDQQFDKTTNTTLATIAGSGAANSLEVNVAAGKWYSFEARLFVDADVVGGGKYAIGGTATATSIIYNINAISNATNAFVINSRQTAIGGSAGQAGATALYVEIKGTIKVNAAGTLTVQFAQNASNGTSSVLLGSSLFVKQMYQ